MTRRRYYVTLDEREVTVDVEMTEAGELRASLAGEAAPHELTLLHAGQSTTLLVGGRVLELYRSADGSVTLHPGRRRVGVTAQARSLAGARPTGGGDALIKAPMPGRVLKLLVAEGQTVSAGAGIAVVEAMKMENELLAPRAGTVKRVLVAVGDAVERDAPLVELA